MTENKLEIDDKTIELLLKFTVDKFIEVLYEIRETEKGKIFSQSLDLMKVILKKEETYSIVILNNKKEIVAKLIDIP